MAENSLSLSNLEGVQPSISQENKQVTNDLTLSNLEGVKDIVADDKKELSISNLEGVDLKDSAKDTDYVGIDPNIQTGIIFTGEPTDREKIAYGIDKQNMFFGNVFRVAKAGIQAAFDPDKEFKEVALNNAAVERAELYKRHEKFKDGKYDNDIEVLAAEMATFLVDPYYIFMYATPWGRAMSMRQQGLKAAAKVAGVSAAAISLDKLFDNLATTGEANPKDVAQAGGIAAVLGPASMKAFQIIGKLFPKADKQKIAQVIQVIDGKTQKQLGVSKGEYRVLQKIAGDKDFLKLNKQISTMDGTAARLVKEVAVNEKAYLTNLNKIDKQIANLRDAKKVIKGKGSVKKKQKVSDKIAELKKLQTARDKEFNKAQRDLWKRQSEIAKNISDETAKRNTQFLEKLWKEKSLTAKTAQVVLASSIRPLMGAAVGYGFGKLWGPDDANLSTWMLVGATLGGIQKSIQASKILPGQSKNMIQRLLYQDATKFTFQKARELTSTTTSSKLSAIGGDTEKIGLQLLEGIDSAFARSSVTQRADTLFRQWQRRTLNVVKPYSLDEQAAALAKIRGSKAKYSSRVNTLAKKLETELQDFKKLREDAGIFSIDEKTGRLIDIKNYFPRVYNYQAIKADPKKFEKTLIDIFKSLGYKDAKAKEKALVFARSLENADASVINQEALNTLIDGVGKKGFKTPLGILKSNPLSEHITKSRILEGPYAKVEKILEQGGYLVNNPFDVLTNLYSRSMKSIAFAEKFGHQGQLLRPYINSIVKKYENLAGKTLGITQENYKLKAAQEIKLVMNTIDGYFGRYGSKQEGVNKSIAGTLATIANLNMLDRVTIASLGDIVQPFANSNNFTSFIRGAIKTGFTGAREKGLATNLELNIANEIRHWLLKSGSKPVKRRSNLQSVVGEEAALKFDDGTKAANVMGEMGTIRKINEFGFNIMGLSWLTGLARRYAYNVGTVDAYLSSNKLAKFISANGTKGLSSSKGLRLTRDINKYGLDVQDALRVGRFSSFDEAVANKGARKILNQTGILAANRDALIPQVQNRLLFAQSQNPWIRLMGQFTSWAMAKSTQTNKLLTRIEDGEAKQMVKLLASLPVYGGIQMLRELAKHGEVMTDPAYEEEKWWAEALRLSGMSGILPELAIGRLTGPGSQQPWFIPFPAASVATDVGLIFTDSIKGDTDKASRRFWEKVMPFPTYRKWIKDLFSSGTKATRFNDGLDINTGEIIQQKFNKGDIVLPLEKPKEKIIIPKKKPVEEDMNKKDMATVASAAIIAGAISANEMNKAVENKILPAKKTDVVVKKDYSNVSALESNKKDWLINTAKKVYKTNKDNIIPNDIILAINSEETGWGTSRFVKDGSNNLFNIQVFDKNEPHIKARGSDAMIKKYPTEEDSIKDFLNMVANSKKYQKVRDTIAAFNNGEASKADIIKSIANTGYAENKNWSSNVTGILKRRIDGKNKEELKSLYNNLFVDKE
jgi:flagellum-specific peptidoglycan hydrolase FlgJ